MYPLVVIMDPAMTKVYGTYQKSQLDSKMYRELFKDAMSAHRDDVSDRLLVDPKQHDARLAAADQDPMTAVKKFADADFEGWTSRAGTTISARLVSASMQNAIFVDRNGREIELSLDQLDEESAKRVRERLAP